MPHVLMDAATAVLAEWLVEESTSFDAEQAVAAVETSDSRVIVEARQAGVLLRVLVAPGATVTEGTPLAVLGDPDDVIGDADLIELGVATIDADNVIARPLPRRIARDIVFADDELGCSGPDALLVQRVHAALVSDDGPVVAEVPAPSPAQEVSPMTSALETVRTRFSARAGVPAAPLMFLLSELDDGSDPRVSVRHLMVKAAAAALRRSPETSGGSTDVAFTVVGAGGVVIPVVRDPGSLTVTTLASRMSDLHSRALEGRLIPDELATRVRVTVLDDDATDRAPDGLRGIIVGASLAGDGPNAVLSLSLSADGDLFTAPATARWLGVLLEALEHPIRLLA
jgi:pyruvate dehydrogenase E2 component (dihydrolipoamide acetyltransferase)